MNSLVCSEPVLPDFSELTADELAKIVGAPLKCVRCGGVLELRCPEGHLYVAPRTISPNIPRPLAELPPERRRARPPASVQPLRFPGHKASCSMNKTPATVTHRVNCSCAPRTYKPKVCACGVTFQPTGPRDIRCSKCRGIS